MRSIPFRTLSNRELLALLVGEEDAAQLARRPLIDLFELSAASATVCEDAPTHLPVPAVGAAKELMARALTEQLRTTDCLDAPATVRDLLRLRLAHLPHELFVVLLLDARHHLIDFVELFRGTLTQTSVYPREVVKLALTRNAAAVLFAHNHPSGAIEPSTADETLTRSLKDALALIDVRVLDHFIVAGPAKPISFAERGLL